MYCNIEEAFGSNSTYIKNYLDNEMKNEKLLERHKSFDTFFEKPKIIEHFQPEIENKQVKMNCDNIVEHVLRCSYCRNSIIEKYISSIFGDLFSLKKKTDTKKILTIALIVILIVIAIKIIWKL